MSTSTESVVLTHKDIRLRENFYRIETPDDVVALLRNLLAHCNEQQLPFDDCMGEAVTAPPLAPTCRRADLEQGALFVAAFCSGVTEYRAGLTRGPTWIEGIIPGGFGSRSVNVYDIVHIGTKKEYQRLVKERKRAEEARKKLEGR
jgi:hypothetical protein